MQIYGDNFDVTYSPVAGQTSIRTIYAISARHGLQIHQMDVNNAFLNADLDTDSSYMKGIDMTTTSKIPIIYNYDRSIHRSCTNLTNRLPHSIVSISTSNYYLRDPITEFTVRASLPSDDITPYSYGDALLSPEWPKWEIAIKEELEACTRLKGWEKSQKPNKKLIDTR